MKRSNLVKIFIAMYLLLGVLAVILIIYAKSFNLMPAWIAVACVGYVLEVAREEML
jgi:hypothetical protein